ncbi:MAG: DUF2911 domain-containing protein [Bacteroidetes bacterium]|nr:DUF2911 domain-containing protein [Bacteroidota bacterium]MDA1121345.1 DUF2911 domain-containing protein [Bacteroidota bacterium]
MLKKILIGLGVVVLIFVLWSVYGLFIATPASPPATTEYSNQGLEISVNYSRPYKKGRLIFGEEADDALQPYGVYWRLGANAATEITFNKDVLFAGKPVRAGSYRMYAVPGAQSFKVTLNSELDVFFGVAEPDPALDILTVDAPVTMQNTETEMFTININSSGNGAQIDFVWDKVLFSVPVTVQ